MHSTLEDIFEAIREMNRLYPDWRFGEIVANISLFARGPMHESIWDVEDDEFLAAAREHVEKRKKVLSEK